MSSVSKKFTRRDFLKLSAMGVAGVFAGGLLSPFVKRYQQPQANVTILKATSYSQDLVDMIWCGLDNYPEVRAKARGGCVVLKPNLVDFYPNHPINTHPAVVAAAVSVFRRLGAQEVIVAEGPGHKRDMEMLLIYQKKKVTLFNLFKTKFLI